MFERGLVHKRSCFVRWAIEHRYSPKTFSKLLLFYTKWSKIPKK